jgi:hypothetical protein
MPATHPIRFGSASPTYIDIELMDANPLSHFLSPTILPDDDLDDFIFDLDAGIEDPKHPRRAAMQSVVSPSTLDYFRRPNSVGTSMGACQLSRSPSSWSSSTTSDTESDMCTTDEDEDDEDECFVRFAPPPPGTRADLGKFTFDDGIRDGARSRRSGKFSRTHRPRPTSAPSPTIPTLRVSPFASTGGSQPARAMPISPIRNRGQLAGSPRSHITSSSSSRRTLTTSNSWREPSPDVWSISEEAEEEPDTAKLVDVNKKSKKKVRFVLPAEVI